MKNIRALSPLEMKMAEDSFKILVRERNKGRKTRNYHNYKENKGRKRTTEKSIALDGTTINQKRKIKKKEKLSIYDICKAYQPSLQCGDQKMSKDIHNTTWVLNYIYTKGWITFEHKNRGKRGINTHIYFNADTVEEFLIFYRKVLR